MNKVWQIAPFTSSLRGKIRSVDWLLYCTDFSLHTSLVVVFGWMKSFSNFFRCFYCSKLFFAIKQVSVGGVTKVLPFFSFWCLCYRTKNIFLETCQFDVTLTVCPTWASQFWFSIGSLTPCFVCTNLHGLPKHAKPYIFQWTLSLDKINLVAFHLTTVKRLCSAMSKTPHKFTRDENLWLHG